MLTYDASWEKAMAPHSSILAWKIPWMEEPGGLQSMGSLRVRHDFTFTFHFHELEKEMAIQSSVLAWRIPGTGEPGGLPSTGWHRVGHDWSNLAAAAAALRLKNIHVNFKYFIYLKSLKYFIAKKCSSSSESSMSHDLFAIVTSKTTDHTSS